MIIDIGRGTVTIRDAESILGLTLPVTLTAQQTRIIAGKLLDEGTHTAAADGLMRAADQSEQGD